MSEEKLRLKVRNVLCKQYMTVKKKKSLIVFKFKIVLIPMPAHCCLHVFYIRNMKYELSLNS